MESYPCMDYVSAAPPSFTLLSTAIPDGNPIVGIMTYDTTGCLRLNPHHHKFNSHRREAPFVSTFGPSAGFTLLHNVNFQVPSMVLFDKNSAATTRSLSPVLNTDLESHSRNQYRIKTTTVCSPEIHTGIVKRGLRTHS